MNAEVASPALAQNPNTERGFAAAKSFAVNDLDSVNLYNGNLLVTIPIGPRYPVSDSLSYGFTLVYNGKLWEYEETEGFGEGPGSRVRPAPTSNAGFGWRLSLGELRGPSNIGSNFPFWVYISPDGGEHPFSPQLHLNAGGTSSGIQYSIDGTYLRFRETTREVEFPDGTIHRFDTQGRLVAMNDRFPGARDDVKVEYGAGWTITDAHGREHTVSLNAQNQVTTINLAGFAGQQAIWSFGYTVQNSVVGCPHNDGQVLYPLPYLTSITLPAGAGSYTMPLPGAYNIIGGDVCNNDSGLLRQVSVPTGGRFEWDYGAYKRPDEGSDKQPCRTYFTNSLGVVTRRKIDLGGTTAVTTYSPALEGTNDDFCIGSNPQYNRREATTTVTDALGHVTVNYFSGAVRDAQGWRADEQGLPFTRNTTDGAGRFLSRQVFQAPRPPSIPALALRRSIFLRYEDDGLFGGQGGANQRNVTERTRYDENGQFADVNRSNFDGFGHYRTETTGGNFPSGNVRTATTTWNPSRGAYPGTWTNYAPAEPWLLGRWAQQTVTEGSSTLVRQACFSATTGFLERERLLKNPTPGTTDVITLYEPDGAGHVMREKRYGGDLQPVSNAADLCTLGLPAQPAYWTEFTHAGGVRESAEPRNPSGGSLGFKSLDLDIDPSTGLPSRSRDPALRTTTFTHDVLGRQTRIEPAEDGPVVLTYTPAAGSAKARVTVEQKAVTGSATLTSATLHVDGFGRIVEEQRSMPGAVTSRRLTTYDGVGNLASRSEWATTPGPTTRWRFHDPFGRPGRVVYPDNKTEIYFYGGIQRSISRNVATDRDEFNNVPIETAVVTSETYDRQGRLVKVSEPIASSTDYSYDAANRLTRVTQGVQTRSFTYDGRGFLLSETHPELGPGSATYSLYDALGNPGRKVSGGWTLETAYDDAGRPEVIEEIRPGGVRRLWKEWSYGTGTGPGDRSMAQVKTATRHNWVIPPWDVNEIDVPITETWTYGGRGGRPSQLVTAIAAGQSFTQSFVWNQLGDLQSQTYPVCTHATCTGSPGAATPRTVSYGYSQGLLTNVTGYGTLGYHANGMISTVTHANAVTDTITTDAQGRARPASITFTGASVPWTTGALTYDAAGNIAAMGSDWFEYDAVQRLVTARLVVAGVERKQTYTFDLYGNRTASSTQVGGGAIVHTTAPVNAATNRLTAAGYDAAGNVTQWQGATPQYKFDPFNQMVSSPGKLNLYGPGDERLWEFAYTTPYDQALLEETYSVRGLGGQVLREYKNLGGNEVGNWAIARDYIYRGSQLLAAETANGRRHYHLDHLGTPRLITDDARNAVEQLAYYPFGEQISAWAAGAERMKFTGHERDGLKTLGTNDDLDYMHARYCSPSLGRFLSVDPVMESVDPYSPQTWNRYTYVAGNPLKFTDPTGKILSFVGIASSLGAVEDVANETLYGVDLVIGADGVANLVPNNEVGPPSPEQQALTDVLSNAIAHADTVAINVTSRDPNVAFGNYATGRLDIADVAGAGNGRGVTSAAVLAHEIAEQTEKQTLGLPSDRAGFNIAHPAGVAAQQRVSGYQPLSKFNNLDRQLTGQVGGTHQRGGDTVTMTFQFVRGNLVSVRRVP